MAASRRRQHNHPHVYEKSLDREQTPDDDDDDDDAYDDGELDTIYYQGLVQEVFSDMALAHPIMYDTYNLCEYVKEHLLSKFTIPVLKEICSHLELTFKTKYRKADLIATIDQAVKECSCWK